MLYYYIFGKYSTNLKPFASLISMFLKHLYYFHSLKTSELENEKFGINRRKTSFCSLIQSCNDKREGVYWNYKYKLATFAHHDIFLEGNTNNLLKQRTVSTH